ncbi:MAG TPA: hypothetical protein VHU79_08725, partial [Sphingomicrobium sp.]|nr:hypothetical protein [Sphingomicrobium sp.]
MFLGVLLRQKRMGHRDRDRFEDQFGDAFTKAGRRRNFALFERSDRTPGEVSYIMLVAGDTPAEKLSPGGWEDAGPRPHKWSRLVGHPDIA